MIGCPAASVWPLPQACTAITNMCLLRPRVQPAKAAGGFGVVHLLLVALLAFLVSSAAPVISTAGWHAALTKQQSGTRQATKHPGHAPLRGLPHPCLPQPPMPACLARLCPRRSATLPMSQCRCSQTGCGTLWARRRQAAALAAAQAAPSSDLGDLLASRAGAPCLWGGRTNAAGKQQQRTCVAAATAAQLRTAAAAARQATRQTRTQPSTA